MQQSIDFADLAQQELISTADVPTKGVRQAGFHCAVGCKMPAVLVELDFICNAEAERFLASEKGRQKCAEALFNAFKTYRKNKNSIL